MFIKKQLPYFWTYLTMNIAINHNINATVIPVDAEQIPTNDSNIPISPSMKSHFDIGVFFAFGFLDALLVALLFTVFLLVVFLLVVFLLAIKSNSVTCLNAILLLIL